MTSFRGKFKLEPHPLWSLLGFYFNFPMSIPSLLIGDPPVKDKRLTPSPWTTHMDYPKMDYTAEVQ